MDLVVVPSEGKFRQCYRCGMQINPSYPWYFTSKECSIKVERKQQREAAVTLALAFRQQFLVHGDVLEQVEVFKYRGRLLAQDDNDIQVIRAQLRKARATWARVGQVLSSPERKCLPSRCGQVLQGRGAGRASVCQQDVGPLINSPGKAGGVPHLRCLSDGAKEQTVQGTGP